MSERIHDIAMISGSALLIKLAHNESTSVLPRLQFLRNTIDEEEQDCVNDGLEIQGPVLTTSEGEIIDSRTEVGFQRLHDYCRAEVVQHSNEGYYIEMLATESFAIAVGGVVLATKVYSLISAFRRHIKSSRDNMVY